MRIEDLMSRNFSVLPDRLSPRDACEQLAGGAFGVVIDEREQPHCLVTAVHVRDSVLSDDLSLRELGSKMPRAVVVECESTAAELEPSHITILTDTGARGAVILDTSRQVVGVVAPRSMILTGLSNVTSVSATMMSVPAAISLGGVPSTAPPLVGCLKTGCGFLNLVHYLDDDAPPECAISLRFRSSRR